MNNTIFFAVCRSSAHTRRSPTTLLLASGMFSDEPWAAVPRDVANPVCRCAICKRLLRDFKLLLFVRLLANTRGRKLDRRGESQQVTRVTCNAAATSPRLTQAHIKRETRRRTLQSGAAVLHLPPLYSDRRQISPQSCFNMSEEITQHLEDDVV